MILPLGVTAGLLYPQSLAQEAGVDPMTEAEFESFYRETAPRLRGYLRRICGDRSLADDLLQETFLRFCRVGAPPKGKGWKPYLYRIATNLVADYWRHSRGRAPGGAVEVEAAREVAAAMEPDTEAAAVRRREIEHALADLKPRERALLWLAYFEGSDHREIAATLGLSRPSVKVLLFRARRKLADVLKRRGIGPEVLS
jgi:RNA polymerase sigma-70 factor (ECF subfamily)